MNLPEYKDDHSNFCANFLHGKQFTFTPKLESCRSQDHGEPILEPINIHHSLKKKLIMAIKKIKADKNNIENSEASPRVKRQIEDFNEDKKMSEETQKLSKISLELTKMPPILNNNVKMFINKIRRIGYLNDLSVLSPYDLRIINDTTYFPDEPSPKKKFLEGFRSLIDGKLKLALKLLYLDKPHEIPLIHPYNSLKLIWDLFMLIVIIFLLFYIPLTLSFGLDGIQYQENMVISLILWVDMMLELNTLYFKYGLEVRSRSKIFLNYLKGYFFPDLISLFAILFQTQSNLNEFKKAILLCFFLKGFAVMRSEIKITNRLQLSHEKKGVKDLLVLFFVIIFITHLAACGWYFIGKNSIGSNDTWIQEQNIVHESWVIQYQTSFYWAIVTVMTVGYGDITPTNNSERSYCLFLILFGGMIFPYSVNTIGLIIQDIQKDQKRFEDTLDVINAYMRRKNINSDLKTRVREYLNFIWREEKSQNVEEEKKVINSLSNSLKEEINLDAYGFFLKKNPLFTNFFSEVTLKKLVTVMKEIFLTPDDQIFQQNYNEDNPGIYFIGKGTVRVYSEQTNKAPILLKELKEGEFFGERSFFTGFKRENTTVSAEFTTLFVIRRDDFISKVQENRIDYENFAMIREKLVLYNDYSSINKSCFSCHQFSHIIEECPKLHFVPNVEKIIKTYVFPLKNFRQPFTRLRKRSKNSLVYQISIRKVPLRKIVTIKLNMEEEKNLSEECVSEIDNPSEKDISSPGLRTKSVFDQKNEEPSFGEGENGQLARAQSINTNSNNKSKDPGGSFKILNSQNKMDNSISEGLLSRNNSEKNIMRTTTCIEKGSYAKSMTLVSNYTGIIQVDQVHNFVKYFPNGNIENILRERHHVLASEREIKKKFLKHRYISLKNYTFFMNIILENFLKENKAKKHKTNLFSKMKLSKKSHHPEINLMKESKKESSKSNIRSPLQRKTFFASVERRKSQIVNFADLINTLVEKNRKKRISKKESLKP